MFWLSRDKESVSRRCMEFQQEQTSPAMTAVPVELCFHGSETDKQAKPSAPPSLTSGMAADINEAGSLLMSLPLSGGVVLSYGCVDLAPLLTSSTSTMCDVFPSGRTTPSHRLSARPAI